VGTAIASITPVAVGMADPPHRTTLSADALVDTRPGGGDVLEARSDTRTLARVRTTWPKGVSSRIPWWTLDRRVASYVLELEGDERREGFLWARGVTDPRDRKRRSVVLWARVTAAPIAILRAGLRPSLDVRRLPPGTHRLEVVTTGAGRRLLRVKAPCRRGTKTYAWKITVNFNGKVRPSRREHNFGFSCVALPPTGSASD
jgi:hypothetical protein